MRKYILSILVTLFNVTAFSADLSLYPEKLPAYINDYANVLDASTESKLNEQLRQFDLATSNQFVVFIFPELKGILEETSLELFRKWRIGQVSKNNGLLLSIFIKDEMGKGKMRFEVGNGLEGVLPDSRMKLLYENEMREYFKVHNFGPGIQIAIDRVKEYTEGEYVVVKSEEDNMGLLFIAIFPFTLGIFWLCYLAYKAYVARKIREPVINTKPLVVPTAYYGTPNNGLSPKTPIPITPMPYKSKPVAAPKKPVAKPIKRPLSSGNCDNNDYSSSSFGTWGGSSSSGYDSGSSSSSSSFDSGGGSCDGGGSSGDF